MNKSLFVLFVCLFTVMIGFGITLPVLPFYAERLAAEGGISRPAIALHVTLLTSIYALMQLLFAPLWGQWSDQIGRRPLVLLGITGSAITQVLFGVANSLWLLYGARIIGGFLSSAILPVATAYVADETDENERSRGMAWLGTAISLGVVVGPALGGLSTRTAFHFSFGNGHFLVNSFSIPFFAAAALTVLTLFMAVRWLPESLPACPIATQTEGRAIAWRRLGIRLRVLLSLAIAGQFGLAVFESTFALYAQEKLRYGPAETGVAFMVCGLIMAIFQVIAVGYLARHVSEILQVALGFGLMGISFTLLSTVDTNPTVLSYIALLALGMSFIAPNLATLISDRGGSHRGAALGLQNAANSLGQVGGSLLGGVLFTWQAGAPYLFAGFLLVSISITVAWKAVWK